jgi:uncharacterized membrane protein YbhN (UPF0104 family)
MRGMGQAVGDAAAGLAAALQEAIEGLARTVSGAALGWLLLGVVLHLANQVVRGRGWYAILCAACDDGRLRRRDALGAWVAGAGAAGVLSARGGDAVRVLLLSRRMPGARNSVLAGTLVAEGAGDTLVGVAVVALALAMGAAPEFGMPGPETAAWVVGAVALLALVAAVLRRRGARPGRPAGRLRRAVTGVGCGCAPLAHPARFAYRVLPWQVGSRLLRAAALLCFLAAFHLPATAAAVLLVMLAQTGGRLVPLAPASAAAAVGVLVAGFGPATGASVSAGAVTAFMVGMSTVLTVAGVVIAVVVVCVAAGPRTLVTALRPGRAVPAAQES